MTDISESEFGQRIREVFRDGPPSRYAGMERDERRLQEAGDDIAGLAFGRRVTPERLAESRRLVAEATGQSGASTGSAPADLTELDRLTGELARLAESRMGMSPQRAQLHAQSELLRFRESATIAGKPERVLEEMRSQVARVQLQAPLTRRGA